RIYGLSRFANEGFCHGTVEVSLHVYIRPVCAVEPLAMMQIACFGLNTSAALRSHYACRISEAGSNPVRISQSSLANW
ncbi:hypothetical protein, partial [Caballeronia grimmiae]|uniref:hypothetical protein n=1 Tax=Caballeronia grimmiae TaxID=1071679 RepID=UPI0038BAB25D